MTDEYDDFTDDAEQPLDEDPAEAPVEQPAEQTLADDAEEPAEQTSNGDAAPALAGPDHWPPDARAEVARLRRENKKHRIRRREMREAQLAQTYGADVMAMIPPEVTDFSRREELAKQYAERLGTVGPKVPAGLAAVTQAPATGTAPAPDAITLEEFRKLVEAEGSLTVAAMKHGHRLDLPGGNPLKDGQPRRTTGTYKPPS
jgi:hypothetical protein